MNKVFILDGLRSHIGVQNGIFRHTPLEELGAAILKKLACQVELDDPDQIICGNVVGAGGNIGRLILLQAGFSDSIPAVTIDAQCASGLTSVALGYSQIKSGQCDLVIAGGVESTSLKPRRFYHKNDQRYRENQSEYHCAQFSPNEYRDDAMILGAERTAKKEQISKEELDRWAMISHQKASKAQDANLFRDLILPIAGSTQDESIRPRMSEKLLRRAPVLYEDGVITAANACTINDGAAFLILCSEKWLQTKKARPRAEILDSQLIGCDPRYSPLAANQAVQKLLKKRNLTPDQIDLYEYNEAFGVIDVLFEREFPHLSHRYNLNGGALAYGHPYGASGAILLLHLLKNLELQRKNTGIAAIAAAGGVGQSLFIRRQADEF